MADYYGKLNELLNDTSAEPIEWRQSNITEGDLVISEVVFRFSRTEQDFSKEIEGLNKRAAELGIKESARPVEISEKQLQELVATFYDLEELGFSNEAKVAYITDIEKYFGKVDTGVGEAVLEAYLEDLSTCNDNGCPI